MYIVTIIFRKAQQAMQVIELRLFRDDAPRRGNEPTAHGIAWVIGDVANAL